MNHIHEHCGRRLAPGVTRQTVLVSATLSPPSIKRAAKWCPEPKFVAYEPPTLAPAPAEEAAEEGGGGGARAAGPATPAWGWGATGWDGPASAFGPRNESSAGGVAADRLMPSMPPQLRHLYVAVPSEARKVDTLRRAMHALDTQQALVFMNFQHRLRDAQHKLEARSMEARRAPRAPRAAAAPSTCCRRRRRRRRRCRMFYAPLWRAAADLAPWSLWHLSPASRRRWAACTATCPS